MGFVCLLFSTKHTFSAKDNLAYTVMLTSFAFIVLIYLPDTCTHPLQLPKNNVLTSAKDIRIVNLALFAQSIDSPPPHRPNPI